MTSRTKLIRNLILVAIYLGAVVASYLSIFFLGMMILTAPWSMVIIMLGMLLIHVASYSLSTYMLGGAAINALLMIRWALIKYASGDNPD